MIRIIVGDLAQVVADAVVRPTTTTLAPFSSNLRRLEAGARDVLPAEGSTGEALAVGAAIVTAAGNLPSDFLIHAAIAGAGAATTTSVKRAVLSALQRASDWQFPTIAFPPMGVGPGHLVMETTAEITMGVLIEYLKEQAYPTDVLIVVGNNEEKAIFETHLSQLSQ